MQTIGLRLQKKAMMSACYNDCLRLKLAVSRRTYLRFYGLPYSRKRPKRSFLSDAVSRRTQKQKNRILFERVC